MEPPQFTRCCTQAGEVAAAGLMTSCGRPPAICGCACKIPSNTHRIPKPTRSRRRARGSCHGAGAPAAAAPCPPAQARVAPHATRSSTKMSATMTH